MITNTQPNISIFEILLEMIIWNFRNLWIPEKNDVLVSKLKNNYMISLFVWWLACQFKVNFDYTIKYFSNFVFVFLVYDKTETMDML